MKKLYYIFFILFVFNSSVLFSSDFSLLDVEDEPQFSFSGYVELDNVLALQKSNYKDLFKKDELKLNFNSKYGKSDIYFISDINIYLLPNYNNYKLNPEYKYYNNFKILNNGTILTSNFELNFREFYINYDYNQFRFRFGNQIISWGTADAFNPTSYFNPYDLREFLFKNQDNELNIGITVLDVLYTFENNSIELVISPIHTPSILPVSNTYWSINTKQGPFPIEIENSKPLGLNYKNISTGIKYYTNLYNYDLHFSYFHGIDKEPILKPIKTNIEPYKPVSILVKPDYNIVNMLGFATTKTFNDFVFQVEAVYSPDKTGLKEYNIDNININNISTIFENNTKKSHYINYSIGLNYFLPVRKYFKNHEGETVMTIEWNNAKFFDTSIQKPILSDIITARLQDSYFNNNLTVKITGIIERDTKSFIFMPTILYNTSLGISFEISYIYINMNKNSYFYCFNNNDSILWRINYAF